VFLWHETTELEPTRTENRAAVSDALAALCVVQGSPVILLAPGRLFDMPDDSVVELHGAPWKLVVMMALKADPDLAGFGIDYGTEEPDGAIEQGQEDEPEV